MGAPSLPGPLSARLPLFYGWIVLACLCCAGFARQGPAVATLSIFVEPLTREFGWSRTALSGAASLGGLLAAIAAPLIGPVLDRRGSRLVLCAAVLVNGVLLMLLSLTPSLLVFYLLFCIARMNWAAPFELGLYGALNNWFVRRRAFASSTLSLAQAAGLIAMPLVAQIAIVAEGWRAGWLAIGALTLLIGFLPIWLLLVRRPEDLGLLPDGAPALTGAGASALARGPARAGAGLFAAAGARDRRVLAVAALYRPGLPGAGRREPAPGAVSDRARHRSDDRRDDRQHVFADLGAGDAGLRRTAASGADPLSAGAERGDPDARRSAAARRGTRPSRAISRPACSGSASARS